MRSLLWTLALVCLVSASTAWAGEAVDVVGRAMVEVFREVRHIDGPVLVHVLTKKGRGYAPAENNPTYFHGVGCFEPETGLVEKPGACPPSYTQVFGRTLLAMARNDKRIMAITAAMPEGTGLAEFASELPDQFVDVGICEQHAVTFAAGLAIEGFRPVVAIYSTFMAVVRLSRMMMRMSWLWATTSTSPVMPE